MNRDRLGLLLSFGLAAVLAVLSAAPAVRAELDVPAGSGGGVAVDLDCTDCVSDAEVSDTLTCSIFQGTGSTTDAVDLATAEVAGTLPVNRGGTGAATHTSDALLKGAGTSAVAASCISDASGTVTAACSGGIVSSGATTDVTTGTNEAYTIAPNGTGDVELNADTVTVSETVNGHLQLKVINTSLSSSAAAAVHIGINDNNYTFIRTVSNDVVNGLTSGQYSHFVANGVNNDGLILDTDNAVPIYLSTNNTIRGQVSGTGVFEWLGGVDIQGTTSVGTCTLNGASPSTCTATVTAATSTCTCSPQGTTAAIAAGGCAWSVSGTTLTLTGPDAATSVVAYHCF